MSIQIRGIFTGACVMLALVTRGVSAMPVEYTQALDILGKRLESPQEMKASETQAISLLEAARLKAIDPDQKDDVNLLLGYLYRSNEDADKAISCYREVMAHNPERQLDLPEQKISGLSPITGLGYSYETKGELERAVACWEVRLRSDPSAHRISAHLTLAYNALEKAGKLPIIEVEPKDLADRLAAIEQANVRAADLTSFEKSCQKVIKSLPNPEDTGKVYARIVEVLVAKGSKEAQGKSLAYCEKAVQYPLDLGTASRLYENWGYALYQSPEGPDEKSAGDYAKARPAAVVAWLRGLNMLLNNKVPSVSPSSSDVSPAVAISGDSKPVAMDAARERTKRLEALIVRRRKLKSAIVTAYTTSPHATAELKRIASNILRGHREVVDGLVARVENDINHPQPPSVKLEPQK